MTLNGMYSFLSGFFYLTLSLWYSSMLIHERMVCSFSLLCSILLFADIRSYVYSLQLKDIRDVCKLRMLWIIYHCVPCYALLYICTQGTYLVMNLLGIQCSALVFQFSKLILWLLDMKSQLIGKDPDAGKD